MQRLADSTLIALFVVFMWLPLAATLAGFGASEDDEREAAPPLRGGPALLDDFPGEFESWWSKHFGLRAPLLHAHALVSYRVFGASGQPRVIVGKDGWLFYGAPEAVEDWRGTLPSSASDLAAWQRVLEERRDWLAERGIAYVFVIAPNKHTIYGRHLPDSINRVRSTSRRDQLVAYLRAHSDVEVLDLQPALHAAARSERVYHKTDSHWNSRGARVVARQILTHVARHVPSVGALGPCDLSTRVEPGGDLARILTLENTLLERVYEAAPRQSRARRVSPPPQSWRDRYVTECDDSALPRAVVFRDSFGRSLVPFLAESFRRTVFVSNQQFDDALLRQELPDVVIDELVERDLQRIPQNPPDVAAAYLRRLWSSAGADTSLAGIGVPALPGNAARLSAPALSAPGDTAVLRVVVTSPAAVWLLARYDTADGPREAKRRLRAGRNDLWIELPGLVAGAPPEIELDAIPATYCLHAVELRAVSLP